MMRTKSFSYFREHLKAEFDLVVNDHLPLVIPRKEGNVVIISEEDYRAMDETMYLLSMPESAKKLKNSISGGRKGGKIFKSKEAFEKEYGLPNLSS